MRRWIWRWVTTEFVEGDSSLPKDKGLTSHVLTEQQKGTVTAKTLCHGSELRSAPLACAPGGMVSATEADEVFSVQAFGRVGC